MGAQAKRLAHGNVPCKPSGSNRRQAAAQGLHVRGVVATSCWTEFNRGSVMATIIQVLLFILDIAWFLVLAQVILSWLVNFEVLNLRQPLVYQIWSGLNRVLEPIYAPIRRILPNMGGIDLSPIVVIVAIYALQRILINNYAALAY